MNIGLIGCGQHGAGAGARLGAPGALRGPGRRARRGARRGGRRRGARDATPRWPQRADLVVLCHKPAQLQAVAEEVAPHAKAVASILAATPLAALKEAYPDSPSTASSPRCPSRCARAPSCRPPGPAQDAGNRQGRLRAVRRARHARRARRRARGRRDGADVVRARLRGARRRGADRRRRAQGHPGRPGRRAGRADARRARPSCCAGAATTRWRSAARSPRRAG